MYLKKIIVFICFSMFFFKGYSSGQKEVVKYYFLDKNNYIPQLYPFKCIFDELQEDDYYEGYYVSLSPRKNVKPLNSDNVDDLYTNSTEFLLKNKFKKLENLVLFWDDNLSFDFLDNCPILKTLHIITHSNLNGDFTNAKKKIKNLNIKVSFESFYLVNLPNLKGVDIATLDVFFLPWQFLLDKNLPKKIDTYLENKNQNENLFYYLGLCEKKLLRYGQKPISVNPKVYNPVPKNGNYTIKHKNGKLFFKGKFKKGLPDGKWVFYNDIGEILEERHYSKGKAVGEWYAYGFKVNELLQGDYCKLSNLTMTANFNKDTLKKVVLNTKNFSSFGIEDSPPFIIDSMINIFLFDSTGKYCISHLYERYDDLGSLITKIYRQGEITYLPYSGKLLQFSRVSLDVVYMELLFKGFEHVDFRESCKTIREREKNGYNRRNYEIKYILK